MYAEICSKLQQKTNQRLGIGHMVWYKRVSAGWDHHDHMEKNLIIRLAYNWASERVSQSDQPSATKILIELRLVDSDHMPCLPMDHLQSLLQVLGQPMETGFVLDI